VAETLRHLKQRELLLPMPIARIAVAAAPAIATALSVFFLSHLPSTQPTSKRFSRVGKSTAVMSETCLNWHWVWSRRKVRTGTTAGGGM
jgi:hypothetical protein